MATSRQTPEEAERGRFRVRVPTKNAKRSAGMATARQGGAPPPRPTGVPAEPTDTEEPDATDEVEQPTDILVPEYAIGVGLITREEYELVRHNYYTQSQWTLGLIGPVLFLWIVLGSRGLLAGGWQHVVFGAVIALAFVGGMDRLHNYHAQLQALIAGKLVAKLQAKEAAEAAAAAAKPPPGTPPPPTLKDVRSDIGELRELVERELQRTPVTIVTAGAPGAPAEPPDPEEPDSPTQRSPQGGR